MRLKPKTITRKGMSKGDTIRALKSALAQLDRALRENDATIKKAESSSQSLRAERAQYLAAISEVTNAKPDTRPMMPLSP